MGIIEEKGRILPIETRLDPKHTALVIIDVQNDFCHPEGVFGRLGNDVSMMPAMADRIRHLVEAARQKNMAIFFVRATYDEEVLGAPLAETYNRRGFTDSQCAEGSWNADWYAGLASDPASLNEIAITKHRFSVFQGTPIDLYLRSNNIQSLVFTGVVTSGCVESSLREAFFRDYYVVCARDAVAEASSERHTASLSKIDQAFGHVLNASQIAEVWSRSNTSGQSLSIEEKRQRVLARLEERVEPAHTALILIDMQNDFCHPDGVMGRSGENLAAMREAIAKARDLLDAARRHGARVIHVRAEYSDADASEVSLFASRDASGTECCRPGSWGAQWVDELRPAEDEWQVVKHRFSAFVDTRLELLLRTNGLRSIIVCGVATQCCVESTVRDASLRDYYVVVANDAVAARGRMAHLHRASLETMSLYFADCQPTKTILEALGAASTEAARLRQPDHV